jgi:hypothetical protein
MMQPIQERNQIQAIGKETDGYWGYFWLHLDLPFAGPGFDQMTLADFARREFQAIEVILSQALGHGAHQQALLMEH